jgi:hypothetical protein
MPRVIAFLFMLASALALAPGAHAQSLPLGTITVSGNDPYPCTAARNGRNFYPGMSCFDATVSCPNTANINLTFGAAGPADPQGTVVLFSGGDGTSPTEYGDNILADAASYVSTFEVVQLEWASPWQDPSSNGSGGNMLTAACRQATFLNYINNSGLHVKAMCAQGSSMGSAALGYSMAWYGAASYLKNVELIAGPVLSEIDQGCAYPNAGKPTICGSGTSYCSPKTAPWTDAEYYRPGDAAYISTWSGLPGSNGTGGKCASSTVNPAYYPLWAEMSIVDGTSAGATPTFSYPTTPIHGWLCTQAYQHNSCIQPNCPNNTSAQGKFFYDAVSAAEGGNPNLLKVTGTLNCRGPEGVVQGTDPDAGGPEPAAITADMNSKCK